MLEVMLDALMMLGAWLELSLAAGWAAEAGAKAAEARAAVAAAATANAATALAATLEGAKAVLTD